MRVYFCLTTALSLLRLWAQGHGMSLHHFHHANPSDTHHLPSRILGASASLHKSATTLDDVLQAFSHIGNEHLRSFLVFWLEGELAAKEPVLHLLAPYAPGRHQHKPIVCHQSSLAFPSASFLKLAPGVYISSPELLFVQMAAVLPFGELLALGFELCGGYPFENSGMLVRSPLTTPHRISAFVAKFEKARGIKPARVAAQYLLAKSASKMETELSIVLCVPRKWGGYGLPRPTLNEPVALSSSAARIARSTELVIDLLWKNQRVGLEYDGHQGHLSAESQARDSRRRDALAADGIKLLTVTAPQFASMSETDELAFHLEKELGRAARHRKIGFSETHGQLRKQVRDFHNRID